jgi:serine/threonine protein kinase
MAMQMPVVDAFWTRLEQSGLISARDLPVLAHELGAQVEEPELARALVQRQLLTPFQAERLLEGRSRGFFYDRYKVVEVLGVGGMSWVYQAQDTTSGEFVGLKVLLDHLEQDGGMIARLQQEARIGLRLDHPHVLKTLELGAAGGLPYMTMEFVPGPTLLEVLLQKQKLGWPRACEFARQAALGLEHAHQRGVVHRDVKPHNLLLDATGRVRLLDFGLAMVREGETGDEFSMAMIFGHECVGTAEFIAPEQADDSLSVDGRSDVYSLGGTLFTALTGTTPFQAKTTSEMVKAHRREQPRNVREIAPAVPAEVAAIVARMLEKDRDRRFATAAEVAEALAPWATPAPVEFDFADVLAERKRLSQDRPSQVPRSRPTSGLASSTARPAATSSMVRPASSVKVTARTGKSSGKMRSATWPQPGGGATPEVIKITSHMKPAASGDGEPSPIAQSQATLTPVDGGDAIALVQPRVLVGRRDDCDVEIADTAVSSKHCELSFDPPRWSIKDLDSRNGTSVNGLPIKQHSLRPGDVILVGKQTQLRLDYALPEPAVEPSAGNRSRTALLIGAGAVALALIAALAFFALQ